MTVDIHLPDLSFARKIGESFYINRGVYNTIDKWFYDNKFLDVAERRKHILNFLQYKTANMTEEQPIKRLSFPDGLTNTLENYVEHQGLRM